MKKGWSCAEKVKCIWWRKHFVWFSLLQIGLAHARVSACNFIHFVGCEIVSISPAFLALVAIGMCREYPVTFCVWLDAEICFKSKSFAAANIQFTWKGRQLVHYPTCWEAASLFYRVFRFWNRFWKDHCNSKKKRWILNCINDRVEWTRGTTVRFWYWNLSNP